MLSRHSCCSRSPPVAATAAVATAAAVPAASGFRRGGRRASGEQRDHRTHRRTGHDPSTPAVRQEAPRFWTACRRPWRSGRLVGAGWVAIVHNGVLPASAAMQRVSAPFLRGRCGRPVTLPKPSREFHDSGGNRQLRLDRARGIATRTYAEGTRRVLLGSRRSLIVRSTPPRWMHRNDHRYVFVL